MPFFLQGEGGIRNADVTGVQTWTLPISQLGQSHSGMPSRSPSGSGSATGILDPPFSRIVVNNSSGRTDPSGALEGLAWLARSEERRVGKEGRSRWSPYH